MPRKQKELTALSKNLLLIIKKWGFNQETFATYFTKMSKTKVSTYTSASAKPSILFMIELSDLTGLPVKALFQWKLTFDHIPNGPLPFKPYQEGDEELSLLEDPTADYHQDLETLKEEISQLRQRVDTLENQTS